MLPFLRKTQHNETPDKPKPGPGLAGQQQSSKGAKEEKEEGEKNMAAAYNRNRVPNDEFDAALSEMDIDQDEFNAPPLPGLSTTATRATTTTAAAAPRTSQHSSQQPQNTRQQGRAP